MKRRKNLAVRWLISIVAVSFLLSGCATGTATGPSQAAAPSSMENLLVQAGFKLIPESNPRGRAICQKLPAGQFCPHQKGDQTVYGYVIPGTQRLYVGDEAAYQRFINLAVIQKLEERDRPVAEPRTDPEFWQMWQDAQGGGG
jgi:hypothetical protein